MARIASKAVAGYYPTPEHLISRIAKLIAVKPSAEPIRFAMVDPCAGDGAALFALAGALFDGEALAAGWAILYGCELEASRYEALNGRRWATRIPMHHMDVVKGDAFGLRWSRVSEYGHQRDGATLLYLNPPYDLDPVHGRLEERFLTRFASTLAEGGVLVFVVPYYALAASARSLATQFADLRCFRFPEPDFEVFKQVVLVARRRELLSPDPAVVAQVGAWARDAGSIPELVDAPVVTMRPTQEDAGFAEWKIAPVDLTAILARAKPWHSTERGGRLAPLPGILPAAANDLLARSYPVAMPPRAAHIAAGIAAGVFNGARIEPDASSGGLPALLVKGVFDREFVAVDEKRNKDGDKVGEIQVQQPRLVVTALDLRARRYHTIKSATETTGARSVAEMTTADLLASYGRGMMGVMLRQCPVLHDPARAGDQLELPELPRRLYTAQAQAVMATVKLLGGANVSKRARRGRAAFVLGEIGSGKSSVALATAVTIGAKRVLVMCPPHLLDSWRDQAQAVVPWARVVVLSDVQDVDALAADTSEGLVIAVLSRETAKLGHALEGVTGSCPACGAGLPKRDLAKTRARCEATRRLPASPRARYAKRLGLALLPIAAAEATVAQLFEGRHERRLVEAFAERPAPGRWEALRGGPVLRRLVRQITSSPNIEDADWTIAMLLLVAIGDDAFTAHTARTIYRASLADPSEYRFGSMARTQARAAALLMTAGCTAQETLGAELAAYPLERSYGATYEPWKAWREACASLAKGEAPTAYDLRDFKADGTWRGHERGSLKAAVDALGMLALNGAWTESAACNEPLYQAIPEPRRYPLASYIAKRAPRLFDLLVLDEGHEFAGDGSAQGFAAHRLVGLGTPTLLLTGSVMGGYAESLFANQWSLDPEFRVEFARDQRQEFVRRYGYLKQLVETKNADGKVVAFGAVTDRVERTARTIGNAPGVLPVFVLRYLLRLAVTLHKSDLALDLPARHEIVERVEPSAHQKATLKRLQERLVSQIRRDSFGPLSGKLWGQMAELPSYLDRATADTGNVDGGAYVIAYPEGAVDEGLKVVAEAAPLPASELLPKEAWMLERVKSELAEGRRVMILAWHSAVLPRLARLVEAQLGEKCPVLDAGKVQASKRQAWIDREVIAKGRRVLVVNPVAVQTGLNNLVHFSSQIWMENPGVNAIVYRQGTGRIDRIGQERESRIYFPVYAGTTQEALHKLLLHKVGVSMSTDGLDGESALQAAGVGVADGASALAVGRQLYDLVLAGLGARATGEAA
jgi:hypothetical protein